MKNLKTWKIVNYVNTDVLFHERSPKCIVARSEQQTREGIHSVEYNNDYFYILHWMESTKPEAHEQIEIINHAVEAWEMKKSA